MPSVNKIILMGNLGHEPEARATKDGTVISKFSLATTEKRNGEDQTEWHNIVMFGKVAEIANKYLQKGDCVYLEGKMTYRKWQDKEGNKRMTPEVTAFVMQMVKTKGDKSEAPAKHDDGDPWGGPDPFGNQGVDDTDLPF